MRRLILLTLAAFVLAAPGISSARAAPLATTGPVTGLFDRGVTLTGVVDPRGAPTRWAFEFGAGDRLNRRTTFRSAGSGTGPVGVRRSLTVQPGTRYSYRLIAVSGRRTVRGSRATFTTPAPAAPRGAAKLSVARAGVQRSDRRLDVLAPITKLASGAVSVAFEAAGRTTSFTAPVDSAAGRVRFLRRIGEEQADRGTGILTLTYPGSATTQPQQVRLRAAAEAARLAVARPQIAGGRLVTAGTLFTRARGVVRLQLVYTTAGTTRTHEFKATVANGQFRFDQPLDPAILAAIARRSGVVHSYTLFTGYLPARMRGEMKSYQVLPAQ